MNYPRRFQGVRLIALTLFFSLFMLLLWIRLFRLQLVQAELYQRQSETNRIRVEEIPPLRGLMLDRNQRLIVDNYPSYTLMVVPYYYREESAYRDTLLSLINLDEEEFLRRLNRIPGNRYTPVRILHDLPFNQYAAIEERCVHLPGVSFQIQPKRAYLSRVASHSLGHIGELKEDEVSQYSGQNAGDMVGLSGLEKTWNHELIGKKGYVYHEVDAMGRVVGLLEGVDLISSVQGSDLILTIDLDLQEYAEELLGNGPGAIVCLEPATGEVLVIASKPDYPPETFANVLSAEQWNALQSDPDKPLIHRAIQGVYPPGSIFKMAVLSAGLESGVITPQWEITCRGGYQFGRRWYNCWNKHGHGNINHQLAIEASCDVFFYLLGAKLGIDRYYDMISRFGFGNSTGIDLPNESEGILPNRSYFDKRYGKGNWSEGVLFNIAIGQGEVLITPIQAAVYSAILANGGWWITPHLVKNIRTPAGLRKTSERFQRQETGFSAETMSRVREDMLRVTEGGRGTARWLYDPRVQVAGKTGSAQNPRGKDHALFVAFAPYEDPQIAVAVIVEFGEHGSTTAAPIAYKIIRRYLGLDEDTWRQYRAGILGAQKKVPPGEEKLVE